jgi:hypothetical protein
MTNWSKNSADLLSRSEKPTIRDNTNNLLITHIGKALIKKEEILAKLQQGVEYRKLHHVKNMVCHI